MTFLFDKFFYKLPDTTESTSSNAIESAKRVEERVSTLPINEQNIQKNRSMNKNEDVRFFDKFNAGGGSWYVIHLLAACGEYDALAAVLRVFGKRFTCAKCRKHIVDATKTMPPKNTVAKDLFYWSVDFHNDVNKRISDESGNFIPRVTATGANALYQELTIEADRDGKELAVSGTCKGCEGSIANSASLKSFGMISTKPTQTNQDVPVDAGLVINV